MDSRYAVLMGMLALACTASADAQNIEQRITTAGNGNVDLVFAAKPGVCGDGESYISTGRDDEGRHSTFTRTGKGFSSNIGTSGNYRSRPCNEGPVHVKLVVEDGKVVDVETTVGGDAALNTSVRAATDYLLTLAETTNRESAGKHAILPALLADSVDIAPRLLQIGRNTRALTDVRESAIFWLGQSGAAIAPEGLSELLRDDDEDIAKAATFGLSQLHSDEGTRILIAAARDERVSSEVRKSAIFWLSQAAGDKATEGLKDLLTDENTEVKKQAVFALSQIKSEASVSALLDVVKNSQDPEVRKSALFWLSQSEDPRVLALFEDILLK